MTADRVTYNEPDNWLGPDHAIGQVDEIVLSDATVHLEMLSDSSAYLHVVNDHREVFTRLYARRATWRERRQTLAGNDDRLRDHLRAALPNPHTIWSIPLWRRPWAAVTGWWELRQQAGAILCVNVDEDQSNDIPLP